MYEGRIQDRDNLRKEKAMRTEKRKEKGKRRKKIFWFDPYECGGAEIFLEDMAKKGWKLVDVVNNSFYFEPMEPQELRYAVKVFNGASEFDLSPGRETGNYVEYCEAAGWQFVTSMGKIHYFYEREPGARPIETDSRLERKAVVKATWSRNWYIWLLLPVLIGMNLYNFLRMGISNAVTSYLGLVTILLFILVFLFSGLKFILFHIWLIQMLWRERVGKDFSYRGLGSIRLERWVMLTVFGLCGVAVLAVGIAAGDWMCIGIVVFTAALIVFCYLLNRILRRAGMGAGTNLVISISAGLVLGLLMLIAVVAFVLIFSRNQSEGRGITLTGEDGDTYLYTVYEDELPVTLEDVGISGSGIRSSERNVRRTALAGDYSYYDEFLTEEAAGGEECTGLYYQVFASDFDWIMKAYEREREKYRGGIRYEADAPEHAEAWGAKEILCKKYGDGSETWIIIYENAVLEWDADVELTEEQIKRIRNRLHEEIPQLPAA